MKVCPAIEVPADYKKRKIPKAMREALWIHHYPTVFSTKCKTTWCPNTITAFSFQAGHNVPESKGGITSLENLIPICPRCNLSMGNRYTFDEWCKLTTTPTLKYPIPVIGPLICKKSSWCCFSAGDVSTPR